jgi:general secretion pathway protein I
MTNQASQRGVALLEVMIATVIVAAVIAAFASVSTASFVSASQGRDKMLANWIALNDITEMRLSSTAPSVGESSDPIDFAGIPWRIERNVEETPVENIHRVDVNVFRDDDNDDIPLVVLSGFIGTPVAAVVPLPDWAAYTPSPSQGQGQGNTPGSSNNPVRPVLPGINLPNPGGRQ